MQKLSKYFDCLRWQCFWVSVQFLTVHSYLLIITEFCISRFKNMVLLTLLQRKKLKFAEVFENFKPSLQTCLAILGKSGKMICVANISVLRTSNFQESRYKKFSKDKLAPFCFKLIFDEHGTNKRN